MPDLDQITDWPMVSFGDVVTHIKDRVQDVMACGLQEYVRGEHFEPANLRLIGRSTLGDGKHGSAFCMRFRPGDVLYVSRNPQLRKAAIADFEGICANTTYVCRAKEDYLLQDLLPFIMQTESFVEYTIRHKRGSTNFYLNWSDIAGYEFALPPMEEQRRILKVLSALSSSKQSLESLSQNCESLLGSAIDHVMSRYAEYRRAIGDLVSDEAIHRPQDGNHGELHPKSSQYTSDGIPFIMVSDVRDGDVRLDSCKFLPKSITDKLRIGFAMEGDVLLTHKATLGHVGILRGLTTPYAMLTPQVTYYRVKDTEKVLPEFLAFALSSSDFLGQMKSHGRQSTRDAVSITTQQKLIIPVPPVDMQKEAVSVINPILLATKACRRRIDANALHGRAAIAHILDNRGQA